MVESVSDDAASPGRSEQDDEPFLAERIDDRLKLANVFDGFHAGRPAAQLAESLRAAQEELGHNGQFCFVDSQPLVEEMTVLDDAAIPLDLGNGSQGAELLDYVVNRQDFRIDQGHIHALPGPGLGVEVDEERVVAASRNAPDWRNPVWRHADGSIAEW